MRERALAARDAVAPGAPDPLVGAMIEVPAAALNARAIARASDFLSIGTNDLVQYTLAADRQDPAVAGLAVAHHPAVIRLIARVVSAAHAAGIPVDVCGEAGGDPELLPLLVGLGVDELSVSPSRLAATRRMVRVDLAPARPDRRHGGARRRPRRTRSRRSRGPSSTRAQARRSRSSAIASSASDASAPAVDDRDLGAARRAQAEHLEDALRVGRLGARGERDDAAYWAAARISAPAGRACRSTPSGRRTVRCT